MDLMTKIALAGTIGLSVVSLLRASQLMRDYGFGVTMVHFGVWILVIVGFVAICVAISFWIDYVKHGKEIEGIRKRKLR